MSERVVPLLKILMYGKNAEPYFGPGSDPGCTWFSSLLAEHKFGTPSYNTSTGVAGVGYYQPTVEYIGRDRMRTLDRGDGLEVPIGEVCRPFIVPRDLGTWNTLTGNQGTFSYGRLYGNPPVLHLLQTNPGVNSSGTTTNTVWGAESQEFHPEQASFGFTVAPAQVSPEYNAVSGGIPYFQVGWSSGRWAVRFFHHGNPVLMKYNTALGLQVPVMELASPDRISYGDSQDLIVGLVRYQRGAVMVSLDHGASYDVWWEAGGASAYMPAGKYQFTGQGCAAALGVHQVVYRTSTYTSPAPVMERTRLGNATILAVYGAGANNTSAPSVASIAQDDGSGNYAYMQYRATFTPGTVTSSGQTYYYSPELYAVELGYGVTPTTYYPYFHDWGATFEGRITECVIDKSESLSESEASWVCRYTVAEGGPIGDFALRRVQIYGGWLYEDGHTDAAVLFTGYITDIEVIQQNSTRVEVRFRANGVSLRPKRMQWRDSNCVPYDGLTANACLAKWCNAMGLDASHYLADSSGRGSTYALPSEFPEKPTFLPTPGESRWNLMEEIARSARLELGETNDGRLALVPNDQWNASPYLWHADPPSGYYSHLESISLNQRVLDSYTGVLVRGETMWGEQVSRWIYDSTAETNIFSSRFRPWPEWYVETVDRPVTGNYLTAVCQSLAYDKILPRYDVSLKGELAPWLSRRDAIWVLGATVGGSPLGMRIGVLSYRHIFKKLDGLMAWTEMTGKVLQ